MTKTQRHLGAITVLWTCLFIAGESWAIPRYVKVGGVGTGTTSWNNASGDLQAMINNSSSGDEVWVAQGTYKPGTQTSSSFSLENGVTVRGGYFGTPDYYRLHTTTRE